MNERAGNRPKRLTRRGLLIRIASLAGLGPLAFACSYSRDLPISGCVTDEGPAQPGGTNHEIVVDIGKKRPLIFVARGENAENVDRMYDRGTSVEITYTGSAEYWKDREEAIQAVDTRLKMLEEAEILTLTDHNKGRLHSAATYTIMPTNHHTCPQ